MEKIASLRTALEAALPAVRADPAKLAIFVNKGRLVSRAGPALGYEWRYLVQLEFHDCTDSPDAIAVPLLLWLRAHQPQRLLDFASDDALGFAADIIDATTWDIVFAFELSEAVAVTPRAEGGWALQRMPEAQLDDARPIVPDLQPDLLEVAVDQIWLGDKQLLPR